jgi:basic membrane protein A
MLFGLLALLGVAGCGGSDTESPAPAASTEPAAGEASGGGPTELKIGFLYSSPRNDGGWSEAHDVGRLALEEAFPGKVTTVYKESVPESPQATQVIDSLIQDGANVIFATSYGFHQYIDAAAKANPDVKFFQIQSTETGPNLSEYTAALEDAYYLAGMAAGAIAKSGNLGMSAEFPIPVVNNYANTFALGAKSINPDAKVRVLWTNSWYDPAKEQVAAQSLVDAKVDVLAQNQNSPTTGQVAEKAGVPFFGSFWHQLDFAPTQFVTGAIYTWEKYYLEQVGQIFDGTWKSSSRYLTMADGVVSLDEFGPRYAELVPQDVQDKIAEVQKQLEDGTFSSYSGPITDTKGKVRVKEGESIESFDRLKVDWYVDNVLTNVQGG